MKNQVHWQRVLLLVESECRCVQRYVVFHFSFSFIHCFVPFDIVRAEDPSPKAPLFSLARQLVTALDEKPAVALRFV